MITKDRLPVCDVQPGFDVEEGEPLAVFHGLKEHRFVIPKAVPEDVLNSVRQTREIIHQRLTLGYVSDPEFLERSLRVCLVGHRSRRVYLPSPKVELILIDHSRSPTDGEADGSVIH